MGRYFGERKLRQARHVHPRARFLGSNQLRPRLEQLEDRRMLSVGPFPTPLEAVAPLGSLIYQNTAADDISLIGETDSFTIDLDDGQTVSLVVDPGATLQPTVELFDPGSASIGAATAGAAGTDAVLQVIPTSGAGTYTVTVGGAADSVGSYTVELILNAAVEEESHDGPANDDASSAEDLDGSFLALAGLAQRGAVLGTLDVSEDWYGFTLQDGESTTLALKTLSAADVTLELYDSSQNLLSTGVASDNANQVINNFVDTTSDGSPDSYLARITGTSTTDYSLVVTRNADFDTEPNQGSALPQDFAPAQTVLGHALSRQQKLTADDAASSDYFGYSVSIDGDTAIVGAYFDDDGGVNSGSAYVFRFDGRQWIQQQELIANDAAGFDSFGISTSISGDTAIVGAWGDDDNRLSSGSAYVFQFDGSQWIQQQKLTPNDGAFYDYFGCSVFISGNTAIVGAYLHDEAGSDFGSAYVFRFDGTQWIQQEKLIVDDAAAWDYFGYSVSISGDTAIVGAYGNDDAGTNSGSAYIFRFDGSQWNQQQKLTADDAAAHDMFGYSVSISGDTAIVGAYRDDDGGTDSGSAYVFRFDGSEWIQQQKLTADDGTEEDRFGHSVSVSGDTAIVGAYRDDDGGAGSGSAYVFQFDGSEWIQQPKLTADDAAVDDRFGYSVSISGETSIVGACLDDDGGSDSGSAYVFRDSPGPDRYTMSVQSGDELNVSTATPADGLGEFVNGLDPVIEMYDPSGALVGSDDNSGPDGRNSLLVHTATATGTYTVRVLAGGGSDGEYVLNVSGNTGPTPPFEVAATDPTDATVPVSDPLQMTIDFSDSVLLSTLEASDVTVGGLPATAVTVVDGDTLVFDLPDLADGVYAVEIAGGAILDLQGTPIESYAGTLTVDTHGPRVIGTSIQEGDAVLTGALLYTAQFDEKLDESLLDSTDVQLVGQVTGTYAPDAFTYDPESSTLTVEYSALPDDNYTLTLLSGNGQLEDLLGWDFDGEPLVWPIPPNMSGDAVPGGDFVVHFRGEAGSQPYPVPLEAKAPLGSLIYDGVVTGSIAVAGDSDSFTIDLDDGQTVSLVVDPDATLQPTVELFDPAITSIGTTTAGAMGEDAVLQVVPTSGAGTYTLTVGSAADSVGSYTVQLILNAAVEEESHDGPTNNDAASAEDLDGSFLALGGLAQRGAVLGTLDVSADWYGFTLQDGESTTLVLKALSAADVTLQLYDDSLNLLAMGTAAINANQVINNFVDTTSDGNPNGYFARITGTSTVDYSLVVTRNADFDTERNDGLAPQVLTPTTTVLGHVDFRDAVTEQKLVANDAAGDDRFGYSVSISGDTAIVGAWLDDYWGGSNSGSAYVFQFDGSQWIQQQKLIATDARLGDYFGRSVSISGDTAIVGAYRDDGVASDSGSAYVFQFDGSQWVQQQKLTADDAAAKDQFGFSVSISGDMAVVGAYADDDGGSWAGSAYVFRTDGSQWIQQQKLTADDAAAGDYFGRSVSISGDTAIVGAYGDDDGESDSGSAYVFQFDGGQWVQEQKLTAYDAANMDYFGFSVSVSGDAAIVGAHRDDDDGLDSGSAYVFQFDGSQWIQLQKLTAGDAASEDGFGYSVSISGDAAIVGAYHDSDTESYSGSAYVFRFDGSQWTQQQKLTAADAARSDFFGESVSIGGDTAIVGASGDDDGGEASGSAYVFRTSPGSDGYSVSVQSGDKLDISTATPADGPGEFVNALDPVLELYDPSGTLVATDDNSDPDGHNALLTHTATTTGMYTVRVLAGGASSGEYVLNITGNTGPTPAFEVAAIDPADGAVLLSVPSQMTIDFSNSVLLSSLEASDLMIGGLPATAVTVVDVDTVVFGLPDLADGDYAVEIAGGAILDLQGTPIELYVGSFYLDATPPRVIASSLRQGDVIGTGDLFYVARFDETIDAAELDLSDVLLTGQFSGSHAPVGFGLDGFGRTLWLQFADLPEDAYTLSLLSGDQHFEDLVGWDLDGEFDPVLTVPSGDGTAGGDFVVYFSTDADLIGPLPLLLQPKMPLGSLVYEAAVAGSIASTFDVDRFTIDLDTGQTVTLVADPGVALQPSVELRAPDGTLLGSAAAGSIGQDAVLQVVPLTLSGTYQVALFDTADAIGTYSLQLILGAAVESESHDGPSNDALPMAEDLDPGFFSLVGGTGHRTALLGTTEGADDWYRFALDDGQSATLALEGFTSDAVTLELYDAGLNLLAAGIEGTDVDRVIPGFLDRTIDLAPQVYYVRIAGVATDYNLVVTRDADFETQSADPLAAVQDITLTGTVLGAILDDAPGTPPGPPVTFAAFGDYGSGSQNEGNVAEMVKSWDPDLIITTGDNNYLSLDSEGSGWTTAVGQFYGEYILGRSDQKYPEQTADIPRFFPTVGNHDSNNGVSSGGDIVDYLNYFQEDPAGGRLPDGVHDAYNSYYDFTWGPVHFFSVDSDQAVVDDASMTAQKAWLQNGLEQSTLPWQFVYFHHTPFSSGMHRSNLDMQWPFAEWGADAVFAGHDHDYERVNRDNIAYFTTGLGGSSIYGFRPAIPDSQVRYNSNFGSMRVIVDAESATFEFLSIDDGANGANGGLVIDSYSVEKALAQVDHYTIEANAGDLLTIETFTPGDGPLEFTNGLDPIVELYDPAGTLVATDDNGAADGRNALMTFGATETGTYTVHVLAAGQSPGEYVLNVGGHTAVPAPFEVAATDPADGAAVDGETSQMTVDFNDSILMTSLDAGDLTIGGYPAVGMTVVDGNTVVFDLPVLSPGLYDVAMAAGSVLDVQGQPLEPFSGQLMLDVGGPRVIASSILGSDVVSVAPDGTLTYTAQFSETVDQSNLDPTDVSLVGQRSGLLPPTVLNYDPDNLLLTLQFENLSEDHYTLTLYSGNGQFENPIGLNLDGEPDPVATVPSGDGYSGGDFFVDFTVDHTFVAAAPWERLRPQGSLVFASRNNYGIVQPGADDDDFEFFLEAGQTISAIVTPEDPSVTLEVSLPGVTGVYFAPAPGEPVVLPATAIAAEGTYAVRIAGDAASDYSLDIYRNASLEAIVGDTIEGGALAIDGSYLDVGSGRFAVIGQSTPQIDPTPEPDVDLFTLDLTGRAGQPIDVVLAGQDGVDFSLAVLELLDTDGVTVLATGLDNPLGVAAENYGLGILAAVVPADGVYTLRLTSSIEGEYALIVTAAMALDTEPNDSTDPLQLLDDDRSSALGYLDNAELTETGAIDWYAITPLPGKTVTVHTATPLDSLLGDPRNDLDPGLTIVGPDSQVLVTDDDSAGDGRNASLSFVAAQAGVYLIGVHAESGQGEYVLQLDQTTGIVGRYVFYDNSTWDDPTRGRSDDDAIATDKLPLLPGGTASSLNYTSYVHGINGITIDASNLPGLITAGDFQFMTGNSDDPSTWTVVDVEPSVSVRPAPDSAGIDRISITWPDRTILNTWLEVTFLANENTGLTEPDIFYFGNLIGDCTGDGKVDAFDVLEARDNPRPFFDPAAIDTVHDFNRDKRVNVIDTLIARNNQTWSVNELELIDLSAGKAARSSMEGPSKSLSTSAISTKVLEHALAASVDPSDTLLVDSEWLYEFQPLKHGRPSKNSRLAKAVDELMMVFEF